MKRFLRLLGLLVLSPVALSASETNCGCGCCKDREVCCCRSGVGATPAAAGKANQSARPDSAAKRHPLRGVIVAVHADTSELRVKHEEIPGVMRAMTMFFKVDPVTIKTVKAGQTITAQMSREDGAWWLHDVKVVAASR
jgi:Cu/Ag efflux protein CusF